MNPDAATGANVAGPDVRDNAEGHRYETAVNGQIAFLQYRRRHGVIVLAHTEVPPALQGHRLASILAKSALEAARAEGLRVIAECPFVRAYLQKHPEFESPSG